ncbi:hypothetical protein JCM16303_002185 [Sporobolomyces ruberrimus]
MVPPSTPAPLVLVRTDEVGLRGEVRTAFRELGSEFPLFFASSEYTPSLEGHKTTLYSRHKQVGSVSLDQFQLGKSREIDSSTFYTRPNFFSDKLVWRSFEGKQLRWKRDQSGSLILIDHKSKQTLATAGTSLSPSGQPRTTLKIHGSLLPAESKVQQSSNRNSIPLSSPSSLSSTDSSSSSFSPPSKLKRSSVGTSPATLAYSQPNEKGTTLELVILSLLHQDYLRMQKEHQKQEEADERSNEWDPW